jgi:hypothetical protein
MPRRGDRGADSGHSAADHAEAAGVRDFLVIDVH